MALSESDVEKQIKHMMAFIEQEANERSEEIDAKAEEEFNIEKGRLVHQQRLKIMEHYERKEKQVDMQKKVQSSNLLNQARLRVLKEQEQHIQSVLEDTRRRLATAPQNAQSYSRLLELLIVQGLFQLMEPQVTVRCRQADSPIIKSIVKQVAAQYKESLNKNVELTVDEQDFLPGDICGGVEVYAGKGRIRVSNTLESRLDMIARQILPDIRNHLFGVNPNRKFKD